MRKLILPGVQNTTCTAQKKERASHLGVTREGVGLNEVTAEHWNHKLGRRLSVGCPGPATRVEEEMMGTAVRCRAIRATLGPLPNIPSHGPLLTSLIEQTAAIPGGQDGTVPLSTLQEKWRT